MTEKEKTDTKEIKPKEQPQEKPDGILTKKINGKCNVIRHMLQK